MGGVPLRGGGDRRAEPRRGPVGVTFRGPASAPHRGSVNHGFGPLMVRRNAPALRVRTTDPGRVLRRIPAGVRNSRVASLRPVITSPGIADHLHVGTGDHDRRSAHLVRAWGETRRAVESPVPGVGAAGSSAVSDGGAKRSGSRSCTGRRWCGARPAAVQSLFEFAHSPPGECGSNGPKGRHPVPAGAPRAQRSGARGGSGWARRREAAPGWMKSNSIAPSTLPSPE